MPLRRCRRVHRRVRPIPSAADPVIAKRAGKTGPTGLCPLVRDLGVAGWSWFRAWSLGLIRRWGRRRSSTSAGGW
ncbi:hypothetical protein [Ornithinimicrobium kibberense]|uniref:hypothetical protein n=1 Tax=Ornithinimicrobium kibberense TaxID=282060 RepID=UPI00361A1B26